MPKKKKITKKEREKNNKLTIISSLLSLLVFLYVFIIEFTSYHMIYIPIEVLFIILVISDYLIVKISKINTSNFLIILVNSILLAYFISIEIILLPLTFKYSNSAYIYKMVYGFLVEHENVLVPILIVVGGALMFPGFKELWKKNNKPIYMIILTLGIVVAAFGIFYLQVCTLINGYM